MVLSQGSALLLLRSFGNGLELECQDRYRYLLKEIASVGHEAEFWLWGGALMTMVLYGVIGNIAGHVSHRVTL